MCWCQKLFLKNKKISLICISAQKIIWKITIITLTNTLFETTLTNTLFERMLLNKCCKTSEHEEILRTSKRQRGNPRIHPDLVWSMKIPHVEDNVGDLRPFPCKAQVVANIKLQSLSSNSMNILITAGSMWMEILDKIINKIF
jgi:hypothetical protein